MTAPSTTAPPAAPPLALKNPMIAVAVLCLGGLAVSLTQTMVIPIQSELPTLLGTSASNTSWVVTITLLAGAVAMPISGRVADLIGKQRVLVFTAALLTIGSVVSAMSSSIAPMLTGRALQGIAMGFIPVGISLIRQVSPPDRAASSIAAMSATMGVGGAIGLPLSAWIADVGNWHALFWTEAAVALVITVLTIVLVPHTKDGTPGNLDIIGAVGLSAGLISFLVGISKASDWGWGSGRTIGAIVAGIVILIVWGLFEWRHDDPLVDLRVTAQRPVLLTNIAGIALGFGMMASSVAIPQLMQLPEETGFGLGQSILEAGLWMAPAGIAMMIFALVSSRIIGRWGPKVALMVGSLVLAVGYIATIEMTGSAWQLLIVSCICMGGVGIGYAAMPNLVLDAVPATEAASALGLNALMRSIGTTLAAAAMATVLTSRTEPLGGFNLPTESAFHLCFVIAASAALIGVGIAAMIPRSKVQRS